MSPHKTGCMIYTKRRHGADPIYGDCTCHLLVDISTLQAEVERLTADNVSLREQRRICARWFDALQELETKLGLRPSVPAENAVANILARLAKLERVAEAAIRYEASGPQASLARGCSADWERTAAKKELTEALAALDAATTKEE